ncbi:DsbA family oxidoreductase [Streptomyces iconiensis]|uniref:DsbA family oxidoreductase n=1 Tax=Streptomyces iconiensis TaxID=1384038 RepID=A0ABT7A6J3_9ACTN|nr:DsbA family oxidoreductase [Streptomyces iconiensis]MDJ1136958.1 DsbA family oxidoreductase [Streptomyces iconiensis]
MSRTESASPAGNVSSTVTVDIWADIACPWCYLGKRRWDRALAASPLADTTRVRWRAFELRPGHSRTPGRTLEEIMRTDWGLPSAQVASIFARITDEGYAEGLALRTGEVRPVNTFDAHRLLKLAATHGLTDPMLEQLFDAYHVALANIADRAVLTERAVTAGLDRAETEDLWRGDAYADAVRADRALATEAGVTAVPAYRVGPHATASGALTTDELRALLSGERPSPSGERPS